MLDPEEKNLIEQKFKSIFNDQFKGCNAHLQKKLNLMKQKFITDHKKGVRHVASDFMDIYKYRHLVNQNVLKAITHGTFDRAKDLDEIGNLMEYEDKHIFLIDQSQWSPRQPVNETVRIQKYLSKANLKPG